MMHVSHKSEKQKVFVSLDSLRGLAATAIAVFHYSDAGWGGYLAVDFFLVLSGFILSHSYLYKGLPTHPLTFISHRLARLYPLHIFTLFTFCSAILLTSGTLPTYKDGNIFTFLQQVTLTHNIGLNPSGMTWNYPSWSVSVEFWVNVIFIYFITTATRNTTLLVISMLGLAALGLLKGHLDVHAENYYGILNAGMLRGMSSFLLGIICYRVYRKYQHVSEIQNGRLVGYLEPICLLAVLILVFLRKGTHSSLDFLAPFLFMAVVIVFSFECGWISRQLNRISYLGVMSYSIYLNQITILILLKSWQSWVRLPNLLFLVIYLSMLLGYSHLTYRYIEKPSRRFFRDKLTALMPEK